MKNTGKTNVMRVLDSLKIPYVSHFYEEDASLSGVEVAQLLGEEIDRVFKTLVTEGKSGQHYVFVIPVREELDLKKAAKVSGEKAIVMIKQKELLPLTGYGLCQRRKGRGPGGAESAGPDPGGGAHHGRSGHGRQERLNKGERKARSQDRAGRRYDAGRSKETDSAGTLPAL